MLIPHWLTERRMKAATVLGVISKPQCQGMV
jgi:hypothetical protein